MIKERIPISGDLGSKVKQLMEYAGWYEGRSAVSYTHLLYESYDEMFISLLPRKVENPELKHILRDYL